MASSKDITTIGAGPYGFTCSTCPEGQGPTGENWKITVEHMIAATGFQTDRSRREFHSETLG